MWYTMCQELEASSGALHRPGALANNLDEVVRKPALRERRPESSAPSLVWVVLWFFFALSSVLQQLRELS